MGPKAALLQLKPPNRSFARVTSVALPFEASGPVRQSRIGKTDGLILRIELEPERPRRVGRGLDANHEVKERARIEVGRFVSAPEGMLAVRLILT